MYSSAERLTDLHVIMCRHAMQVDSFAVKFAAYDDALSWCLDEDTALTVSIDKGSKVYRNRLAHDDAEICQRLTMNTLAT